jgi:hypothetical protein
MLLSPRPYAPPRPFVLVVTAWRSPHWLWKVWEPGMEGGRRGGEHLHEIALFDARQICDGMGA